MPECQSEYRIHHQLHVNSLLDDFVRDEVCPPIGLQSDDFWRMFAELLANVQQQNRALLDKRDELQAQIDAWHQQHPGEIDQAAYHAFLHEIGYLVPEQGACIISTEQVDAEIATMAGPQLVVPVNNARFALNAANARWGSLYDALYGTDMIDEANGCEKTVNLNPTRAKAVINWVSQFLDTAVPLASGSHADVVAYEIDATTTPSQLVITRQDGSKTGLSNLAQLVGFVEQQRILLINNNLHIELEIDPSHPIGMLHPAGVKDVLMESALTTIMDCEDSVAAVDAADKIVVYRNWLGLMRGTLDAQFQKGSKTLTRRMNADRHYTAASGDTLTLHGRSLLFVRNVGHLMTTDAVLDAQGNEVPEGVLDAFCTVACAMHDLADLGTHKNSRTGSIYIVKPKMHGPDEVAFADILFSKVEQAFGLAQNTIKVGIMDEERRTSANLLECIRAVKTRVAFINTGFLDRTGDEIHTSMTADAMLPKEAIKAQDWIGSYENRNVDIGLACGFSGKAQIGKGMWPMPDEMKQMFAAKKAHPLSGANCAWVPSPTAATLHALHYHQVDVFTLQAERAQQLPSNNDSLAMLLTPPLLHNHRLNADTIQQELDNNAQGILGYVVRWIDQGVGCSKVPDINNVGLMEDRATLRISSQHIANWLAHGICTQQQVMSTMERMAKIVDEQNSHDTQYQPMAADFAGSIAFQAACDLVFKGCEQPNGYTEPLLHAHRKRIKQRG